MRRRCATSPRPRKRSPSWGGCRPAPCWSTRRPDMASILAGTARPVSASGYGMAGPRTVPVDTLTRLGQTVAVLLLFSVSGGMLWLAGYNYDGLQGSPLSKIHPSTYLFVLVFVWRSCIFGNPVGYVIHVTNRRPATMLMAVISTALLFVVILRQRPGMAGMIDTFVAPALIVLLLSEDDEKT